MISPLFKVRDYALKDINSYDIKIAWKSDANESVRSVANQLKRAGASGAVPAGDSRTLAPTLARTRTCSQRDARVQGV